METKKKRRAISYKSHTFWTEQRLAKGVTIPTISNDTGLPYGALVTYFSGRHIPREYATRVLCEYFGVDYELGQSKFIEDHEIWKQRHSVDWVAHDKAREHKYFTEVYTKSKVYMMSLAFDYANDDDLIKKLNTVELGNRSAYIKWIMRKHLGNDFFSTERLTPEVTNLLKIIYSEVPFEIFMQMLSTLLDTKTIDAKLLYGYVSYPTFLKIYRLQDCI